VGDTLQFNQPGEAPSSIQLDKMTADNGLISQFSFSIIQQKNNQDACNLDSSHDNLNYFNDVWQNI